MSTRRQVWQTLTTLIRRLEADIEQADLIGRQHQPSQPDSDTAAALARLEKELRKLGKTQLKANTLTESQLAHTEQLVADLQEAQQQEEEARKTYVAQQVAAARQELLLAFLPALDSIEHALQSGRRYLARPDNENGQGHIPADPPVSAADQTALRSWLDGLELTRERLLAVLEAGEVTPIPTVGHPFDPFLHRAVGVTAVGGGPRGTIIAEERTGYTSPAGILRYADVIVYRPSEKETQPANE